ncbi:MAG: glycosyltransferase [Candidatus Falkowbacteria bacterium]
MKIVFVVAGDENLGVEYLADYLKKNHHQVELLYDPQIFGKAHLNISFLGRLFDWKKLNLKKIKRASPDIVGLSCVTATYQWARDFAKLVKTELSIPIIFGGVHPTLVPELVIKDDFVDMVCVGEGEEPLLELLDSLTNNAQRTDIKSLWFKKGGQIIKNEARALTENIDNYCLDKELFLDILPKNFRKEINYLTSRGCPYRCTYCGNEQKAKIFQGRGKYLRQKSVQSVIAELQKIKNEYSSQYVVFVDDVLTMDRAWFREFSKIYAEKIGLPFTCFAHCKIMDEELMILLRDAGCKLIGFGVQSGSEETRRNVLNRYETNEEILQAAELCRKYQMRFMVDHIFDIPFDDTNNLESLRFYNKVRPTMLNAFNLLYFPCAKIIDSGIKSGKITDADVTLINEGRSVVYETGAATRKIKGNKKDNYRKYALLYQLMVLFPQRFFEKILKRQKIVDLIGMFSLSFVSVARILVNIKAGHGFIPLRIIKDEIYWMVKTVKERSSWRPRKDAMDKILIISPFVSPNVGGAETHIDDLSDYLAQKNFDVQILTYQPLTTDASGASKEMRGARIKIRRYAWFGHNIFHRLANFPILNFLYITPYLFVRSFFFMLSNSRNFRLINAHGLNAVFIAVVLKIFFNKKIVFSTMALYDFRDGSVFKKITQRVLRKVDRILAQSEESKAEFVSLGFPVEKIDVFVHWVNVSRFYPIEKNEARYHLGWENKFTVIFVGRLIFLKGVDLVIRAAEALQDITFVIVGDDGPLLEDVARASKNMKNLNFVGKVEYSALSKYYNAADIFLYPARYKEDMARAINESLACGTPVLVANIGAEPYTIDSSVARLIVPEVESIVATIKALKQTPSLLLDMQRAAPKFIKELNQKVADIIIEGYNKA